MSGAKKAWTGRRWSAARRPPDNGTNEEATATEPTSAAPRQRFEKPVCAACEGCASGQPPEPHRPNGSR